jgi:hypothetical protein
LLHLEEGGVGRLGVAQTWFQTGGGRLNWILHSRSDILAYKHCKGYYVLEAYIMYFIWRCWFLHCSVQRPVWMRPGLWKFRFLGSKWHSLCSLPFQGPTKSWFLGSPPPSNGPCNGSCPHQHHYILRHINNRYTITIYAPMIYTALCKMFWMRAYPLWGQVGGGRAMEIESLLGPVKWHWADRREPFGA